MNIKIPRLFPIKMNANSKTQSQTQSKRVNPTQEKESQKKDRQQDAYSGQGYHAPSYSKNPKNKVRFMYVDREERLRVVRDINAHPKFKELGLYLTVLEGEKILLQKSSDSVFSYEVSDEKLKEWSDDLQHVSASDKRKLDTGLLLNIIS